MTTQNSQILPDLKLVEVAYLRPSPHNPRKDFESEAAQKALRELKDSILAQGICQPILARPLGAMYEIVAGERRYRAALAAGLDVVPCIVRPLTDNQATEIQVVENLQRSDLSEFEEAQSYQRLLELKDGEAACYTVPVLAERFGVEKTHIYRRLALLRLIEGGRKAMQDGKLSATAAVLLARIPSPERQQAALLAITEPEGRGPLNFAEARALIVRDYMQGLKGAPFKLDDATLLPEAGPCSTCPKMTDNCSHLFAEGEAADFAKKKACTDPACYRRKLDAAWKIKTEAAAAEGKLVLNERQSRDVFPEWQEAGVMAYESPYVLLNDKPLPAMLKPEVVETVGTWRSLVEAAEKKTGQKVPRVVVRDQSGAAREVVDRQHAVIAIETAGEPIFAGKTGPRPAKGPDSFAEARKREVEAAQLRTAESVEGMSQMHAALVAGWQPSPVWEALFEVAMRHAGGDGLWLVAKWKGLKLDTHNVGKDIAVTRWAAGLSDAERQALVPLLLISGEMKFSGLGSSGFEQINEGAGLGLKLADIERAVKDRMKAEKTAKKAKAEKPAQEAKEPKAKKQSKKEQVAAEAATFGWNEHGVATTPRRHSTTGKLPKGVKCEISVAMAPDGKWRFGCDLSTRMEGNETRGWLPSLASEKFKTADEAKGAGFKNALPFFKNDPAVARIVALDTDAETAASVLGEGGEVPDPKLPDEGDRVEWKTGKGKVEQGTVISRSEWELTSGLSWEAGWANSLPIMAEKAVDGNYLRVVESAALKVLAKKAPVTGADAATGGLVYEGRTMPAGVTLEQVKAVDEVDEMGNATLDEMALETKLPKETVRAIVIALGRQDPVEVDAEFALRGEIETLFEATGNTSAKKRDRVSKLACKKDWCDCYSVEDLTKVRDCLARVNAVAKGITKDCKKADADAEAAA